MTLSARLTGVEPAADPGEIVRRALAYPEAVPGRSFVQLGARTLPLSGPLETSDRTALLAYASNAAPPVLARKLAPLPEVPLPVVGAALTGFDVVYSAHVSPRGAVPGTLYESAGTTIRVAVLLPTDKQLRLISTTEPNYELRRLEGLDLRLEAPTPLLPAATEASASFHAYISRHGPLLLDEAPVALTAIEAHHRDLPSLSHPEVLERVRAAHRPDLPLDRFILDAVAAGGITPLPAAASGGFEGP